MKRAARNPGSLREAEKPLPHCAALHAGYNVTTLNLKICGARDRGPVLVLLRDQRGEILRRAEPRLHPEPRDARLPLARAQALADHRIELVDDRLRRAGR